MTFTSSKDSYEVISEIAKGGMGITYLAEAASDKNRVVVKQLKLERLSDWKAVELFEREGQTLSQLEHPAIPKYIDFFESEQEGFFVLVQSYVEGRTLQQMIDGHASISPDRFEAYLVACLEILAYLHHLVPPVVHRDITPKNIIISDDQPHLVDFGSVKNVVQAAGTFATTTVGTFGYMAPEQILGKAEPGSDLFSLGMTFIALATHADPTRLPLDKKTGRVDVSEILKHLGANIRKVLEQLTHPGISERLSSAEDALRIIKGPETVDPKAGPSVQPVQAAQAKKSGKRLRGCLIKPLVIVLVVTAVVVGIGWLTTLPKHDGEIRSLGGWFSGHADPVAAITGTIFDDYYLISSPVSVRKLAFDPTGTELASVSDDDLIIWESETGEQKLRLLHRDWSWNTEWLTYSPGGKTLILASTSKIAIWRTNSWIKWRTVDLSGVLAESGHDEGYPNFIAGWAGGDSTIYATILKDSTYFVIDVIRRSVIASIFTGDDWDMPAAFTGDGRLAVVEPVRLPPDNDWGDTWIRLVDLHTGARLDSILLKKHVEDILFSPDNANLVIAGENSVDSWDLVSGSSPKIIHDGLSYRLKAGNMAFSTDGKLMALAISDYNSREIRVLRFPSGEPVAIFEGHDNDVTCLAFSPDSRILATGSRDQKIILWDIPEAD